MKIPVFDYTNRDKKTQYRSCAASAGQQNGTWLLPDFTRPECNPRPFRLHKRTLLRYSRQVARTYLQHILHCAAGTIHHDQYPSVDRSKIDWHRIRLSVRTWHEPRDTSRLCGTNRHVREIPYPPKLPLGYEVMERLFVDIVINLSPYDSPLWFLEHCARGRSSTSR